ncbi:cell cycle transcriptional regulator TrcR [Candidatus Tisiphia endosymbiont of Xenochironomus xenolabis]|uniref:cell cycle transcriptional regulator TrcR n=1 Tax=Candidatus Tisiphia endosymbiont of Xenochironomus xenolabis TaxID=3139334 RepID=UPI0035C8E1BF
MNSQQKLPILPRATAIWLIDNTALTFKQIADFCGIHEFEIKGIADGEVSHGIKGLDPIAGRQLTKEEIIRCTKDSTSSLRISVNVAYDLINTKKKQQSKYTPIARRQDKPDAVYWILKNCPEILDNQIVKLVGTTKSTIDAIRDRSHWNMKNIRPRDPVLLGICSQVELDKNIEQAKLLPQQEEKTSKE